MKNQINFLNVGIILIIVGIAIAIYFNYSYHIQKNQQEEQFRLFLQNIQNLAITMKTTYGNYYLEISTPKDIILYSNNTYLIINYNNVNYTVNFYSNLILLNNYGQIVPFLLYPDNIYLVKLNNLIYITTSSEIAQNIIYQTS